MSVEVLIPASRQHWLELRKETIGASEIAALLGAGVHPWITPRQLWSKKSGLDESDEGETPPMKRGRILESVAIDFLREERPDWKVTANPVPGGFFYRDLETGLSATPDAFVTCPEHAGTGICQIKSVAPMIWKSAWTKDGAPHCPDYVMIQAVQEAALTGAAWATVGALVVDHGIDLTVFDIPIHTALMERIFVEAREFWDRVRNNDPPPFDFARDRELIGRLWPNDDGSTIDLSGDNQIPALIAEDATLQRESKLAKDRREAIKGYFLALMKDASTATFNGDIIATAKTVRTKEHIVKASQSRTLRFKKQVAAE